MKKLFCTLLLTAVAIPAMQAGPTVTTTQEMKSGPVAPAPQECFRAHEWNLDVFAAYGFSKSSSDRVFEDPEWGGGLAVGYYFNHYIGVSLEGFLMDTEADATGAVSLNLVARYPMQDRCIAPYLFAGGGLLFNANNPHFEGDSDDRQNVDDGLFEGHIGIGVEYRVRPNIGLFTDIRYTFVEESDTNFGLVRLGLRFVF